MQKQAGKDFPMSDQNILSINSPRKNVLGPWLVVYKDESKRWAIVVMGWKNDGDKEYTPCLGIRWFYGGQGTPSVRGYATWLVIPNELTDAVLSKLPLAPQHRQKINELLLSKNININ